MEIKVSTLTREEVKTYLKSLPNVARRTLYDEVSAEDFRERVEERRRKADENRAKYQTQKEKYYQHGQYMRGQVKPGDVVKVRGTKDGVGVREVLEVDSQGITARKLKKFRGEWTRDSYITTHNWDKVVDFRIIKLS